MTRRRLAAIRETFEESGILLARDRRGGGKGGALLNLPTKKRDEGRRAIYENRARFVDWVEEEGGVVDTGTCERAGGRSSPNILV